MSSSDSETDDVRHSESLKRLESTDPEFYKFLKENDENLLKYKDSDEDSDAEDDQANDDEEEENEDDDEAASEEIENLRTELQNSPSLQSCKKVMSLLKSTVSKCSDDKQLTITDSSLFNNIMRLCLVELLPALTKVLKLPAHSDTQSLDPSKSKSWKPALTSIKSYLIDMIKITSSLNEPNTLELVLKHIMRLIPYYAQFIKIARVLVKKMVHVWSTQQEKVRILAFVVLHRITKRLPEIYHSQVLKQMYFAYVNNVKFNTPSTLPLICFMKRSLTEMYAAYSDVAYEHTFLYLRQLCIHLRNAVTTKKKESFQTVYNWQSVHCILLWTDVVSALYDYEPIKTLAYPLVQLITGTMNLIPTQRYVPLRFHLAKALISVSASTKVFIPVAPLILEALSLIDTEKKASFSKKPVDFAYALKASKAQLQEAGFRDTTVNEACKLLMDYFAVYSTSIAYPELAFLCIHQLKAFQKKNKVAKYGQQVKFVIDKLQQRSNYISEQRKNVTFAITDVAKVQAWEDSIQPQAPTLLPAVAPPPVRVEDSSEPPRKKKRKFR